MTPAQHRQLAILMENLSSIQSRMTRMQTVFPNHYAELKKRYNQMLLEAREARLVPPWMAG